MLEKFGYHRPLLICCKNTRISAVVKVYGHATEYCADQRVSFPFAVQPDCTVKMFVREKEQPFILREVL